MNLSPMIFNYSIIVAILIMVAIGPFSLPDKGIGTLHQP